MMAAPDLKENGKNAGIVDVVGLGLSTDDLSRKQIQIISNADILVGGKRHLECFAEMTCEKIPITGDIFGLIAEIRSCVKQGKRVVVLASGDPLFHGIGSTLVSHIGADAVNIYPNISSVAGAFAAIKEPWHDAALISLHGRGPLREDNPFFERELFRKKRVIAILTDHRHTPSWIAEHLISENISGFSTYIFERLGASEQRISLYDDLSEIVGRSFMNPNVVVLKRSEIKDSEKAASEKRESEESQSEPEPHDRKERTGAIKASGTETNSLPIYTGMDDNLFFHERGLITKSEIRAVSISKLKLDRRDLTLWDLGAGSGSISVEAAGFLDRGHIAAVEKNERRIDDIRKNMEQFGLSSRCRFKSQADSPDGSITSDNSCNGAIEIVHGDIPAILQTLPDPDRIFIGGGGSSISDIVEIAGKRLSPNGVMVINTVLLQTMNMALATLQSAGFHVKLIQMQVSVSRTMPFGDRLEALNPVWIITGTKQ